MNLAFLAPQHPPLPAQPFVRPGQSRNKISVLWPDVPAVAGKLYLKPWYFELEWSHYFQHTTAQHYVNSLEDKLTGYNLNCSLSARNYTTKSSGWSESGRLTPASHQLEIGSKLFWKFEVLWIVGWLMIWSDSGFPIFWWDLNSIQYSTVNSPPAVWSAA